VKWARVMEVMHSRLKIDAFIIAAPAAELSHLVRINREESVIISLEDPDDLDSAVERLSRLDG
ncbi:MAG: hypothetical protein JW941_00880, partial [Candidatus Coatesbacteria bacterium]|nr:hypothetical protein [Candidatus Coatesbacteria bacterium]